MTTHNPVALLNRLLKERSEVEWLEFKHNNCNPLEIGPCISACANSAMLSGKDRAFIVFGIENVTRARLGASIRLQTEKNGGESLINWITRMLTPKLMLEFLDFTDSGKDYSMAGDSKATRAYAWSSPIEGSTKRRFFAVLHTERINSPIEAVRAAIVAEHRHGQ